MGATRIGFGQQPRVAVNSKSRGFFTWTFPTASPSGPEDDFEFCSMKPGWRLCSPAFVYAPANDARGFDRVGGYTFFAPGNRVLLLDARCCEHTATKTIFTSKDVGKTFPAMAEPGHMDGPTDNIAGGAVYGLPGSVGRSAESILTISGAQPDGVTFQATGTGNGSESRTVNFGTLVSGASQQGSLALQGKGRLVVTFATADELFWSKWNGTGDVNEIASWDAPKRLDDTNLTSRAKLVSGPAGVYVSYGRGGPGDERFVLRKFEGSGWGPRLRLTEIGRPRDGDLVEDRAGSLHFAWKDGGNRVSYRHARTADNTAFTRPEKYSPNAAFDDLRLGVGKFGRRGWITGESSGEILAIPFALQRYGGPTATKTKSVGSDRLVLSYPKDCVTVPERFAARVSVRPNAASDAVKTTIAKVVFSRGDEELSTVTKRPFTDDVPTGGLPNGAGSTVTASVTARRGNAAHDEVVKTLRASFSTC